MSNVTAVARPANTERAIEFTPFGAADKIKLSLEIVKKYVAVPTKSGATCTDRDAMRFMMLCQAQRLNPFAGDAYLNGYDSKTGPVFSLITAHVAFMKRAESCKEFEGMESGVIVLNEDGTITEREGDFSLPSENVVGGWAKVYRNGRKPTYRRLSIDQRKPSYETPFWQGAKACEQIVKCAESDALRATFPTLMGGMHFAGETVNIDAIVTSEPSGAGHSAVLSPQNVQQIAQAQDASKPIISAQAELEAIVTGAGFDWSHLVAYAVKSGNIQDPDSLTGFSDIPTDDAKRIVRAKGLLLKELAAIKG